MKRRRVSANPDLTRLMADATKECDGLKHGVTILATTLVQWMEKLHGGKWRSAIDHENEMVVIVPAGSAGPGGRADCCARASGVRTAAHREAISAPPIRAGHATAREDVVILPQLRLPGLTSGFHEGRTVNPPRSGLASLREPSTDRLARSRGRFVLHSETV